MEIQSYLEKMKTIQNSLLTFLEKEENVQDNYLIFDQLLDHQNIRDNQHELKSVLYILSKISENHHRSPSFFKKIDHILHIFKNEIKKYFSDYEIFNIFKNNKEILLFLLEENTMTMNKYIVDTMSSDYQFKTAKYLHYFYPEVRPFIDSNLANKILRELPENYENQRKIEYDDNNICTLIQKDLVNEFIEYVNKTNLPLSSTIEKSLFETNSFLFDKNPTLIEYSAFYGSFQIFNYLYNHHVELTPSLWLYSIHGRNINIIHLLEQCQIKPENNSYENCLNESIKCHHNQIATYIIEEYFLKEKKKNLNAFDSGLQFYNFAFIEKEKITKSLFLDLCQYDYYPLVQILMKTTNFDINSRTISFFLIF